jgi:hypothetical protein
MIWARITHELFSQRIKEKVGVKSLKCAVNLVVNHSDEKKVCVFTVTKRSHKEKLQNFEKQNSKSGISKKRRRIRLPRPLIALIVSLLERLSVIML